MALGDRAAGILDLFGDAYDEFMKRDEPKPPMMGGLGPVTPEFYEVNQGDMPILDEFGAPVRIPMRMEGQPSVQRGVPVGSERAMEFAPPVTPVARQLTPDEIAANMPRVPASDIQMRGLVEEANLTKAAEEANLSKAAEAAKVVEQIQANPEIERQPGFMDAVKGYFGNRENMIRLAMGFNSMRLNPDAALTASLAAELKDVRATRKVSETANKTVARLRAIGTPEAIKAANLIEANPTMAKEIFGAYSKQSFEGAEKTVKGESDLRKEFTGQAAVKDFAKQSSAFGRVVASAQDPSAAGDLALIFNYMKVLDPGSTVREGEFATAQNAAGIPGRVQSLYNSIISGERLNPEQRNDFVDRSRRLYEQSAGEYQGLRNQYLGIADQYGFDKERTVPDLYAQNAAFVRPQISYDQLPAETKARFPDSDAWNRWFNSQPYLEQLKLQGAL